MSSPVVGDEVASEVTSEVASETESEAEPTVPASPVVGACVPPEDGSPVGPAVVTVVAALAAPELPGSSPQPTRTEQTNMVTGADARIRHNTTRSPGEGKRRTTTTSVPELPRAAPVHRDPPPAIHLR